MINLQLPQDAFHGPHCGVQAVAVVAEKPLRETMEIFRDKCRHIKRMKRWRLSWITTCAMSITSTTGNRSYGGWKIWPSSWMNISHKRKPPSGANLTEHARADSVGVTAGGKS